MPDDLSQASSLSADNGLLIGSFARNPRERSYYSQTFYFKNLQTNEVREIKSQQSFNIFSGKTKDDFKTADSVGGVFVLSLPAGRYVFNNFRLYDSSGTYSENWSSKEDYAIPFEVHPRAANYVGEIKLDQLKGRNIFGLPIHAGGIWLISDQQTRDLDLLRKLRPNLPLGNIVSVIPNRKDIFTPVVVLPTEMEQYRQRSQQ